KMYARSTLYAQSGRAEAPRRAMLTYLNDTAEPRNAYPDYWGLSSEWEALSTIGREGYCISISIGTAYRLRAGGGAQAPLHPRGGRYGRSRDGSVERSRTILPALMPTLSPKADVRRPRRRPMPVTA